MANIKIIDLPTGSPESTSFVEATQVDLLSETGRSTVKLALNALGNFVAGQDASPLEYGDLETESTTLIGGINELHDSIGADAYDDTATYAEGELCIYNNTLYVCTVSGGITTPEAWTAAHWTATTIEALIASKQDLLTMQTGSGTFSVPVSDDSGITTKKWGAVFFANITIKPVNDINTYHTELADMGALCPDQLARYSARGSAGNTCRLEISHGKLLSESKLFAGEYYTIAPVIM